MQLRPLVSHSLLSRLGLWIGLWTISITLSPVQAAGVPYQYILLEDFSGSWCNNCPEVTANIAKLLQSGRKVAVAGYQLNETGETSYLYGMAAYERSLFYGTIRAIPSVFIQGKESRTSFTEMSETYDSLIKKTTPYHLQISAQHFRNKEKQMDSFEISVTVKKTEAHNSENLVLCLSLAQDHIQKKWYNQTEINHAVRFMYPSGMGQNLEMGDQNEKIFRFAFSLPYKAQLPVADLTLVGFIQDKNSRVVYQANTYKLYNGEENVDPDFNTSATYIAPSDSIKFSPNCLGQPQSYEWTFEGGEPSSSTLPYPVVRYAEIGKYKVLLKVSKKGQSYSYTRPCAIEVLDVVPRIEHSFPRIPSRGTVQFELLSLSDSCIWGFSGGNPSRSYEKKVSVRYMEQDTFNVTLKTFYKAPDQKLFTYQQVFEKLVIVNDKFMNFEETSSISSCKIYRSKEEGSYTVQLLEQWSKGEVYDLHGKLCHTFTTPVFNLQNLPHGLYIVKIYAKTRIFATKILQ